MTMSFLIEKSSDFINTSCDDSCRLNLLSQFGAMNFIAHLYLSKNIDLEG